MSDIFFTADHHFNHDRIRMHTNRPFDSVEEMNQALIDNWNSVVGKRDKVYCLGDFVWKDSRKIRHQLNGKITLLIGGHDDDAIRNADLFYAIYDIFEFKAKNIIGNNIIVLCHYPMRSWNRSYHGSYSLHGHIHGRGEHWVRSYDVGVDCNNYTPISLDEILEIFRERKEIKIPLPTRIYA